MESNSLDIDLMSAPLELESFDLQGYKLAEYLSIDDSTENSLPQTKDVAPEIAVKEEQISKKLLNKQSHGHFAPPVSDEDVEKLMKPFIPSNTKRSNHWTVSIFKRWVKQRNATLKVGMICPENLLETCTNAAILERWLIRFVLEGMRSKSGNPYPPHTVNCVLAGLLRYMRCIHGQENTPNFVDKRNPSFSRLRAVLDRHLRALRSSGIGVVRKQAAIISTDEEELLWSSGVMGTHSPESLFNAIFLLNGKIFALRGGQEHYNLKISQLIKESHPCRYIYYENGSKNLTGGLKDVKIDAKVVPIYQNLQAGNRCHVFLLDRCLSLLPPEAFKEDVFYHRPLQFIPCNRGMPWFAQR